MKRMIRASCDTRTAQEDYSLEDFILMLKGIRELRGLEISLSKTPSGGEYLVVGDYAYPIADFFSGV